MGPDGYRWERASNYFVREFRSAVFTGHVREAVGAMCLRRNTRDRKGCADWKRSLFVYFVRDAFELRKGKFHPPQFATGIVCLSILNRHAGRYCDLPLWCLGSREWRIVFRFSRSTGYQPPSTRKRTNAAAMEQAIWKLNVVLELAVRSLRFGWESRAFIEMLFFPGVGCRNWE